jgi:hypothetical protein
MISAQEPKLEPPGAGLPLPELLIARMMFGWKRLTSSPDAVIERFRQERAAIRDLVDSVPPAQRGKPVLIARPRGLEDSSRFWSVWMTLDHLRITNDAFSMGIRSLVKGEVPTRRASTANVKPDPKVTGAVETAYEQSCEALLRTVAECPPTRATPKWEHPWFGPMDAAGWHVLSAGHMGIHREQLRRICAGLTPTTA